jgi:hypothetical protein
MCIIGIGIINTISISKMIKITASRKNRKENGIRALRLGSNPHSNGDDFSRSAEVRVMSICAAPNVIITKIEVKASANSIMFMERK